MNVLLVVLDTVRAHNTSLHGYHRETTPTLDALADRGHVYEQARSPGRWSIPSHASMFTGHHVWEHRVTSREDRLRAGTTIFHELGERGYDTGVFSKNSFLNLDDTGLMADFDEVVHLKDPPFSGGLDPNRFDSQRAFVESALRDAPARSLLNGLIVKASWDYPGLVPEVVREQCPGLVPDRKYVDAFLDWAGDSDRWAACVNLMGAHGPYEPSENTWGTERAERIESDYEDPWPCYEDRPWEHVEILEDLYDGCIRDVDRDVGRLIEGLERDGHLEDTLVVIAADHGEGFGEVDPLRGRIAGHGPGAHEYLYHVPLVVLHPDLESQRFEHPVTLTEFPEVVRATLDGEQPRFGEKPVWAFDFGLNDSNREKAARYVDDVERFCGPLSIRYEAEDGGVRKDAEFDGTRLVERIEGTEVVSSEVSEGALEVPFDPIDLRVDRDSAEVSEAVKQDLERLGYL